MTSTFAVWVLIQACGAGGLGHLVTLLEIWGLSGHETARVGIHGTLICSI